MTGDRTAPAGGGISLIVCSRDRPAQLEECLRSLVDVLRPLDQLIVVDSASLTEETRHVAVACSRATVVRVDEPGLSRARNAGLREAVNDVVAFTDDDCAPDAGWLEALEREFADPAVAMVTGRVLPKGSGFLSAMLQDHRSTSTYPTDRMPLGHGANMACRRDVLLGLGGFDELLGAGALYRSADDWDAFYRVMRGGHALAYAPDAVMRHHQWRSSSQALRTRYGYALGAGALCAKLGQMGAPDDRVQARLIARARGAEAGRAVLTGLARFSWFRVSAGLLTATGFARGYAMGRRRPLSGPVYA